jgi:hypothetical protein
MDMALDQLVSNIIVGGGIILGIITFFLIVWQFGGNTAFRKIAEPLLKAARLSIWKHKVLFEEPAGWRSFKSFGGRFYQSPDQKSTTISYVEPRKDLANIVLSPFENPAGLGISMITVPDEQRKKLNSGAFEEIEEYEIAKQVYKRRFVVFQKGKYYIIFILNCHENGYDAGNRILNRIVNDVSWTYE